MKNISLFESVWCNRNLIIELVKHDFSGKYKGSFGGIAWSFFQPLFLLSVYTTAFGVILQARWETTGAGTASYALLLFSGLIIFNSLSEILRESPGLFFNNANFVKKIFFPLELLPIILTLTATLHFFIGVFVWILGYFLIHGLPKFTIIYFPMIYLCLFPLLLATGWIISSIGVYIRDISQFTSIIIHSLLFLTPIFYSVEVAPPVIQNFLLINPLTFLVQQFRAVLFFGDNPDFFGLFLYFFVASGFAFVSLNIFRRLRPSFADMV